MYWTVPTGNPVAVSREVNRQDGGVLQAGECLRFLAEPRDHARRPRDLGMQDLAGEAPVEIHVPQLVHLRESAATDELLHLVLGAERAGEPFGGGLGDGGRSAGGGGPRRRPLARDDGG